MDYLHFCVIIIFFFNDTATTEIYTLSLHDALPISTWRTISTPTTRGCRCKPPRGFWRAPCRPPPARRSEEHTSELQSQFHLVCRLLLEKKKKTIKSSLFEKNKKNKKK